METGVGNTLMNAYVKYGILDVAKKEFDEMSQRNNVSWNTMIVVYAQNGLSLEALELYTLMLRSGGTRYNASPRRKTKLITWIFWGDMTSFR